jgi:peptide/nickel transport system substrate-binding protein
MRTIRTAAAIAAGSLAIASCGGSFSTSSSGTSKAAAAKPGGTLTFGVPSAPATLDPAKDVWATYSVMRYLSNEPLLSLDSRTGAIGPGLATSYSYVGTRNMGFQFTLRQDARFADGSQVTASAVAAWLRYFLQADGPFSKLIPITGIRTPSKWTVRLAFSRPMPDVPFLFAGADNYGFVTGPKGLANPAGLATSTDGAGPYEIDPADSVAGNEYTFIPNPYYYDKSAVHWQKIVVKAIPSNSTMLEALQSGQVNVGIGDPLTAAAAATAGLQVKYATQGWAGLVILDRSGTKSPLGNVLVRQALNYAIDRKEIASALFGKFGVPTNEFPTTDGYAPAYQNYYTYDPGKSKALLAQAGYPRGFTVSIADQGYTGTLGDPLAQSVAEDLKGVGVNLDIKTYPTSATFIPPVLGGDYPAIGYSALSAPLYVYYAQLFTPKSAENPFGVVDQTMNQLAELDATAPPSDESVDAQKISERIVTQADMVPVLLYPQIVYAARDIGGITVTSWFPFSGPVGQWYQTSGS